MANQRAKSPAKAPERDFAAIASRYEHDILSGRILACRETKAACQRNRDDFARVSTPERPWNYMYDPAKGVRVCKFLELLRHIKGPKAGQRIELNPATVWFVMTLYSWVKPDGKRRFKRAYYDVARGNAKSLLSSGLSLYHLCADGDDGAEVYSGATRLKQARIVFDVSKDMAKRCPELLAAYKVQIWADSLTIPSRASKFEPIAAKGDSQDGYNVSFAVLDELHAHKKRDLYDVILTAMGKRPQPLLLSITTAGFNKAGICYEVRGYCRDVLFGKVVDDTQFAVIYTLDPGDDWKDPLVLRKANPLWGDAVNVEELLELQHVAKHTPGQQTNFMTKRANIWTTAGVAYFDGQQFDALADPSLRLEDFHGQPCWIGLDLAAKIDLASKVYTFKRADGERVQFYRNYINDGALERSTNSQYKAWAQQGFLVVHPGNVTDHKLIERELFEDLELFEVKEIGFDANNATLMMQKLGDYTDVVEVRQSTVGMSEPTKAMQALIVSKRLSHPVDPVASWCFANVVCREMANQTVLPRKERPELKIDTAVAAIISLSRADAATDEEDDDAFNAFIGLKK